MMDDFLQKSASTLLNYSQLSFYREEGSQISDFETNTLSKLIERSEALIYQYGKPGKSRIVIVYQTLDWDSNFFGQNTVKLLYVLYENQKVKEISKALNGFLKILEKNTHVVAEIPSTDIKVLQALTSIGFYLNESRINYYLKINHFENERYQVRQAGPGDIDNLKRVAQDMENPYDRFHADPFYSKQQARDFLGKYAEELVKGMADMVLVPNEDGIPPDSFYAARYQTQIWPLINLKASKILLSAVQNTTNKGWFYKLNSEMIYHLKSIGADYVYFQTATANKAVIHSNEKLGYKIGHISHYFSFLV